MRFVESTYVNRDGGEVTVSRNGRTIVDVYTDGNAYFFGPSKTSTGWGRNIHVRHIDSDYVEDDFGSTVKWVRGQHDTHYHANNPALAYEFLMRNGFTSASEDPYEG